MLGTRGCRLGILYPRSTRCRSVAIAQAALAVRERTGKAPQLEMMVPLVDYERELELIRELIVETAEHEGLAHGADYRVGTMIELPRACFLADRIADARRLLLLRHERPDADGARLLARRRRGDSSPATWSARILDRSPFETIDAPGVGQLRADGRVARAQDEAGAQARRLRRARRRPRLDRLLPLDGLDYVSCSPFRVPVARVAAARPRCDRRRPTT